MAHFEIMAMVVLFQGLGGNRIPHNVTFSLTFRLNAGEIRGPSASHSRGGFGHRYRAWRWCGECADDTIAQQRHGVRGSDQVLRRERLRARH